MADVEFSPEDGYGSEVDFLFPCLGSDHCGAGHHPQCAEPDKLRESRAVWQFHQNVA